MTAPETALDVLRRARERVAKGWCRRAYARDSAGAECDWDSPAVASVCLSRALGAPCDEHTSAAVNSAFDIVAAEAVSYVHRWNDAPGRTQAEVLALLDRVIAEQERFND